MMAIRIPFTFKVVMGIPGLILVLIPWSWLGQPGLIPWAIRILGAYCVWDAVVVIRKHNALDRPKQAPGPDEPGR